MMPSEDERREERELKRIKLENEARRLDIEEKKLELQREQDNQRWGQMFAMMAKLIPDQSGSNDDNK